MKMTWHKWMHKVKQNKRLDRHFCMGSWVEIQIRDLGRKTEVKYGVELPRQKASFYKGK